MPKSLVEQICSKQLEVSLYLVSSVDFFFQFFFSRISGLSNLSGIWFILIPFGPCFWGSIWYYTLLGFSVLSSLSGLGFGNLLLLFFPILSFSYAYQLSWSHHGQRPLFHQESSAKEFLSLRQTSPQTSSNYLLGSNSIPKRSGLVTSPKCYEQVQSSRTVQPLGFYMPFVLKEVFEPSGRWRQILRQLPVVTHLCDGGTPSKTPRLCCALSLLSCL